MTKMIDCFLIGHNEMDFATYEKEVRKMGIHSGAYRDLNLNFIRYGNKLYTAPDIFNLFYMSPQGKGTPSADEGKPVSLDETFSAAVAYLGTYLNRRGLTFDYVNSFNHHKEELAEKLTNGDILTAAIITTLYVSVLPVMEIMDFIKKHNPRVRVIIGGPFVATQVRTMNYRSLQYLFRAIGADFFVYSSQGEAALVNIIKALKNNLPLQGINNIYYKSDAGYISTDFVEEDNNLSENMVNWELFSHRVGEFASVRTVISCPFACAFCGFPEHAGKYRTADVEAVEEELNRLERLNRVKSLNIIDDTFNVPLGRFKEILKIFVKNKYPFQWNSHYRCQFADRESLELMKATGCEGVFLGIESGSNKILKNMNKAASVEKYLEGIALLKEYGILTYGSFIIGFPGETLDTVQETIAFIKKSGLDFFRAQLWYCDTMTPIWEKREEYSISGSSFEWSHATMNSKKASDLVEEIFRSVTDPVWVPQYNFECDGIFKLLHRGFSREEVKKFLQSFNRGIKEKLTASAPEEKDIDLNTVMEIKKACFGNDDSRGAATDEDSKIDRSAVEFDF